MSRSGRVWPPGGLPRPGLPTPQQSRSWPRSELRSSPSLNEGVASSTGIPSNLADRALERPGIEKLLLEMAATGGT